MRRFTVSFYTADNGKKITAIRNIREALGIGLVEAKSLIEDNNYSIATVIINPVQIAKLTGICCLNKLGLSSEPYIRINSVEEIKDLGIKDFSNILPL